MTLYSTVRNLPFHDFQVNITTSGKIVAEKFRLQPELPGVIITKSTKMLGMISQVRFLDYMKLPGNKDFYYQHPVSELLDVLSTPPLVLSENFQVNAAVLTALNRPKNYLYEPIVIVLSNGNLRLIDLHDLLLAQSEILLIACKMIPNKTEEYQSEISELFPQDEDEDNDDEHTGFLLESTSPMDPIKSKLKK